MARATDYPPDRQPGLLMLCVNGQRIELDLQPDQRDCRRWRAFKDGAPFARGGLERIWRKVQSELVPLLGQRTIS